MNTVLKTPPAEYPVTLLEAKAHLGILHTEDDDYITSLIAVATEQAEQITGRQLVQAEYYLYMDELPERFELPKPSLVSVDAFEYIPDGGTEYTAVDAALYMVNDKAEPAVIAERPDADFPDTEEVFNAVRITFTAGYGAAADVPQSIRQWMLLRIGTMYEHREEVVVGTVTQEIKNDYNRYLISKYKVSWL